jgi:hypothetical protein
VVSVPTCSETARLLVRGLRRRVAVKERMSMSTVTPAWMKGLLDNFCNIDTRLGHRRSGVHRDLGDRLPRRRAQDRRAHAGPPGEHFTSAGRADPAPAPGLRGAGPAARVVITTLTMTREKDISLHMKDGHV